ncbi:MAG: hypothetical protein B9S32_18030 [Verrucomicrobia bacterium Tous-C9LFEB]|nr:MAG: hypothetical protein B9S32_18030 [Verrucomicrobia bacterium Tous-C9LFEB]
MILVTGGTGFVGTEMVRQFVAAGHRVRVLARHPDRAQATCPGCEVVAGDVLDPASLVTAMQGVNAVVHLVGIIHESPSVSFEQAHVEATANVLAAACVAGVPRFVHMSALGTQPDAVSRYHQTKWAAEELVRQSSLDWTILRPSIIYGPGDKSLNFLAAFLRPPLDFWNFYTLPNLGGGTARVQPISVKEVAQAFVRALSNSAAVGKTYDVCGTEALSWSELLVFLAQQQGVKARLDRTAIGFLLRSLLWTSLMGIPVLTAIFACYGLISGLLAVVLATVWAALLLVARAWRTFLFYTVPWRYPLAAAWLAKRLLPRWLHFGEQLAMLAEDNVGDPLPAQRDLHLKFTSIKENWHYP